jgi:hypothetical protein
MLDWLPAEICHTYGHIESSVLNGPFVRFDGNRTLEIYVEGVVILGQWFVMIDKVTFHLQ